MAGSTRNLMRIALLLLLGSVAATAQQYTISTFAGRGQPPLYFASALTAAVDPMGIAVDAAGTVYFSSGNAVYRRDSGGSLTRIAGGSAGCSGDGGLAINAQLNGPQGIVVDASGAVYVADTGNNRIRKISPDGGITSPIGNSLPDCGTNGVPTVYAPLASAVGVAVDAAGTVYIADGCQCVLRVSVGIVTTFISNVGFVGLAVDTAGNVYVAGARILKITPSGMTTAIPGFIAYKQCGRRCNRKHLRCGWRSTFCGHESHPEWRV